MSILGLNYVLCFASKLAVSTVFCVDNYHARSFQTENNPLPASPTTQNRTTRDQISLDLQIGPDQTSPDQIIRELMATEDESGGKEIRDQNEVLPLQGSVLACDTVTETEVEFTFNFLRIFFFPASCDELCFYEYY